MLKYNKGGKCDRSSCPYHSSEFKRDGEDVSRYDLCSCTDTVPSRFLYFFSPLSNWNVLLYFSLFQYFSDIHCYKNNTISDENCSNHCKYEHLMNLQEIVSKIDSIDGFCYKSKCLCGNKQFASNEVQRIKNEMIAGLVEKWLKNRQSIN